MVPNQYGQFSFLLMMEPMRKSKLCNWIKLSSWNFMDVVVFTSESKYGQCFKTDVNGLPYLIRLMILIF
jgi:hypothetical protein